MLKVYGHPMSTCTRKVLTTLHENGTPHEFHLVDLATGAHKQPAHMAFQPFGQVPAIDDDGFVLYESRAIARYLDQKAGGKLVPADAKGRAKMEQWISVETSNFAPHAMKYIFHHVMHRPQTDTVLEHAEKSLRTALPILEKQLAETPYLAGDDFTLADVVFMPYVGYANHTPAKQIFAEYPNFVAWWDRVSTRPAWLKATGA